MKNMVLKTVGLAVALSASTNAVAQPIDANVSASPEASVDPRFEKFAPKAGLIGTKIDYSV